VKWQVSFSWVRKLFVKNIKMLIFSNVLVDDKRGVAKKNIKNFEVFSYSPRY